MGAHGEASCERLKAVNPRTERPDKRAVYCLRVQDAGRTILLLKAVGRICLRPLLAARSYRLAAGICHLHITHRAVAVRLSCPNFPSYKDTIMSVGAQWAHQLMTSS